MAQMDCRRWALRLSPHRWPMGVAQMGMRGSPDGRRCLAAPICAATGCLAGCFTLFGTPWVWGRGKLEVARRQQLRGLHNDVGTRGWRARWLGSWMCRRISMRRACSAAPAGNRGAGSTAGCFPCWTTRQRRWPSSAGGWRGLLATACSCSWPRWPASTSRRLRRGRAGRQPVLRPLPLQPSSGQRAAGSGLAGGPAQQQASKPDQPRGAAAGGQGRAGAEQAGSCPGQLPDQPAQPAGAHRRVLADSHAQLAVTIAAGVPSAVVQSAAALVAVAQVPGGTCSGADADGCASAPAAGHGRAWERGAGPAGISLDAGGTGVFAPLFPPPAATAAGAL